MASTAPTSLASWRLESAVEPFFSGGAVAALPDGRALTACGDEVKIVNVNTGAVECTLSGDSEPVTAIAAGPCGTRVYVASRSLALRAWRLTTTTTTTTVVVEEDGEEEEDEGSSDSDSDGAGSPSKKKKKRPLSAPPKTTTRTVTSTTAECLRVWKAHKAPVVAMALDPSGGLLATAGADRSARVFDTDAFFCTHAFHGHSGVVTAVCFHPGCCRAKGGGAAPLVLFTAGDDGTVRGWDLEGRSCLAVLRGHGSAVTALVPAPPLPPPTTPLGEAEVSAAAKKDKKGGGKAKRSEGSKSAAAAATATNPAALRLVSAGRDGVVVVWDWLSRSKSAEIAAMEAVEGAALVGFSDPSSPSTSSSPSTAAAAGELTIATAGAKGAVRLWSSASRREVARLDAPGGSSSSSIGSEGGNDSGRALTALVGMKFPSSSASPFAASDRLLAATADGRVVVFDGASSRRLRTAAHLIGDLDEITDVRFLGGARARKSAAGGGEGGPPGWEQPTHVAVATASPDIRVMRLSSPSSSGGCSASLVGHAAAVLALDSTFCAPASSAGGAPPASSQQWLLASGGKDAAVCVWRPLSNSSSSTSSPVIRPCAAARAAHAGAVTAVSWARKRPGRFLVSGGDDRLLKVWDLPEPLLASLLLPPAAEAVGGSAANGGTGSPASQPEAKLTASAATVAHDKAINGLDVSPDDALVATASQDRTAKVWRLPHLLPVATLRGHRRGVWDARFSPAARLVATASGDATVRLWSLPDGACLRSLEGHGASVLRCAFFGGGAGLASVGADGLLKTWSVRTGECASTSDAHDAKAWALDASDDGTTTAAAGTRRGGTGGGETTPGVLATGGADGRLLLWRDAASAVASAAASAAAADAAGAQALANALALGDVRGAAELALRLGAPARLLSAVQAAAALPRSSSKRGGGGEQQQHPGRAALRAAVRAAHGEGAKGESAAPAASDGLRVALEAVRAWNARAATCHEAHFLLSAVLAEFSPAELVGGCGGGGGKGAAKGNNKNNGSNADLFDAILAYTVRHARRADRLLEATYVVEAALAEAGVLSDDEDEDEDKDGGSGDDGDDAAFDDALALLPPPPKSSAAAARRAAAIARLNGEAEGEEEQEEEEEEAEEKAGAAAVVEEGESEDESEDEEGAAPAAAGATRRRSARAAAAASEAKGAPAQKKKNKKRGSSDAAPAPSKKKTRASSSSAAAAAAPAVATPSRPSRTR